MLALRLPHHLLQGNHVCVADSMRQNCPVSARLCTHAEICLQHQACVLLWGPCAALKSSTTCKLSRLGADTESGPEPAAAIHLLPDWR